MSVLSKSRAATGALSLSSLVRVPSWPVAASSGAQFPLLVLGSDQK